MSELQKYKELSKKIRKLRFMTEESEQRITSNQDIYDLGGKNTLINCINRFNRVRLSNGQINDEGGYVVRCENLACDGTFCNDFSKCDFSQQFDSYCYRSLKKELDEAIANRRAFVRELFRLKKRSK